MDRSIVSNALKNAQRLMNSAEFNNKVNGYVNEGAGSDTYVPSSPRKKPQTVEEAYDPMDYTQVANAGINTKLPKNILESMLNNPINVTPANSGFGSVLGGLDTEELERSTPAQLPRRKLNEGVQQSVPMMQPAGIDSNYLKFLVKEAVKECMEEMKSEILNENTIRGIKVAPGNKLLMVVSNGDLYEGQMKLKKKKDQ